MKTKTTGKKRVVIVGMGFGGIRAARVLAWKNMTFHLAEVTGIDFANKQVLTDNGLDVPQFTHPKIAADQKWVPS